MHRIQFLKSLISMLEDISKNTFRYLWSQLGNWVEKHRFALIGSKIHVLGSKDHLVGDSVERGCHIHAQLGLSNTNSTSNC